MAVKKAGTARTKKGTAAGQKAARIADSVKKVTYFAMDVPDRPGEAARILGPLAAAGVNLLAFTGFPTVSGAQLDFIPKDAALFRRVVKKLGLRTRDAKTGFLAQGKDRKGAVGVLLGALASAGINVIAIDAVSSGKGTYAGMFWVRPEDVAKAARVLRAR